VNGDNSAPLDPGTNQVTVSTRPHLWIESLTGACQPTLPVSKRTARSAVMDPLIHTAAAATATTVEEMLAVWRGKRRRNIFWPLSLTRRARTR